MTVRESKSAQRSAAKDDVAGRHEPELQVRLGIAAGWGMLIFLGLGFLLGGFIPPPGPYAADVVAPFYRNATDVQRFGVVLMLVGGAMAVPFGAAIGERLGQIAGVRPFVVFSEMAAATMAGVLILAFGCFLLVAFQRADMPDSSYQLLNHVTWMVFVALWQPGALQAASTAVAVLSDRSAKPLFPRWVGWFSAWMAFGSLSGSMVPFFTEGPFAWNGFISFFVAAIIFFSWYVVILYWLWRIARDEAANGTGFSGSQSVFSSGRQGSES